MQLTASADLAVCNMPFIKISWVTADGTHARQGVNSEEITLCGSYFKMQFFFNPLKRDYYTSH